MIIEKTTIVINNLASIGYGVDGSQSREQWQATCREKFLAGHEKFNAWQRDLITHQSFQNLAPRNFDFSVIHNNSNGTFAYSESNSPFVVDLTNQVFKEELRLENYVFSTGVLFCGTKFSGLRVFNSSFEKPAYFVAAEFQWSGFRDCRFIGDATFDYAVFNSISFRNTKFGSAANFKSANFIVAADFHGSEFNSGNFEGADFTGYADFSGDAYNNNHNVQRFGQMSFSRAKIAGKADFSNRKFEGYANWSFTEFSKVPLFHNSELHQDTTFEKAKFPNPSGADETDLRAYNTLRLAMSKQQHLMAEKVFSKYVLDAEKELAPKNYRFFYTAYKYVSDYGFSTIRPLVAIIFIIIFSCIVYASMESRDELCFVILNKNCKVNSQLLLGSFQFSLLQSLPLGITATSEQLKEIYFQGSKDEFLFTVVIILQKFFSFIGWFLIGLAIRNIFKIK